MARLRCLIPDRLSRRLIIALLVAVLLFSMQPAIPVYAGTLTVTTTTDELASPGTGCSLREAIAEANAAVPGTYPECGVATGGGADTINLPAGIYTLTLGQELLVNSEITLNGAGAAATIIEAAAAPGVATWRVLYNDGGNLTINSVTIRHGRCLGACIGSPLPDGGYAGGIYNDAGTLILDASTVSANQAAWNGGGIYNVSGTVTIQNGSLIGGAGAGNIAGSYGGGISNEGGSLTIDASTVSANQANQGGGIASVNNLSTLNIQNGSLIGGAGAGNTAVQIGGGILAWSGVATIDASTVSANQARDGGGIYNAFGTVTIQNGSLIGGAGAGNNTSQVGGGIYSTGETTIDASTVSANRAGTDGGGIANWDTLNIQNGSRIGGAGAGNTAVQVGGGIYNATIGTTTIDASTVSANQAYTNGGGIANGNTLNIQNGSVIGGVGAGNNATQAGGGIYNSTGTATIDASSVSANQALQAGGGIYKVAGTLNIQNGSLIGGAGAGNTAQTDGGGIYNEAGSTTIDTSTVSENQAFDWGGGIYNGSTINAIRDSVISNNRVVGSGNLGGGIYNDNTATITLIENSRFSGNNAGSGAGGAIYSEGTLTTITRTTFDANRANTYGGGICSTGAIGEISHSTFSNNTAQMNLGGGIYSAGPITTLRYNAFINNRAAQFGSGIYLNFAGSIANFNDNYFNNRLPNCSGTPAGTRNFDNDGTCGTNIGVAAGTDYNATLADNGCVTTLADGTCVPTHALIAGTPLENPTGGANCGMTDQRDYARDAVCDIGPYELPPPEIDVQRPVGTSIPDGGNDPVGAQLVGLMTLTYTISNAPGAPDLIIPAGGVTATNLVNVSGFTVNTALPLSISAGSTATLQIEFNIDAVGAFSFDLDIDNNDPDENPYDIAVSGTGTINLAATAGCNGDDLDVTITAGDDPFDITGTSGPGLPLNGVGIGTYTLAGPDSWTGVTVTETTGDLESANLGNYICPPPAPPPSTGGGGGASVGVVGCNATIDVEADREVVNWGDQVMWTVVVRNPGPDDCQGVQTYGTMPGEFAITDINTTRGSIHWDGGQYYLVELGTLAVSDQVTVSIDSLLQGGAGFALPEGAAGQSAGQSICLTGYITDPVNDTDCVTLFPDHLPSTGGQPVESIPTWVWVIAAGALIFGAGGYAIRRQAASM